MRESLALNIGGQSFIVRPLTFRQVKKLFALATKMNKPGIDGDGVDPLTAMDAAAEVVSIALERDNPAEAALIDDFETTMVEINAAMGAIFKHAGLETVEAPIAGEAEAPAPTGAG